MSMGTFRVITQSPGVQTIHTDVQEMSYTYRMKGPAKSDPKKSAIPPLQEWYSGEINMITGLSRCYKKSKTSSIRLERVIDYSEKRLQQKETTH